VEAEDFPFEGFEAAGGGFYDEEIFAGGFDFSFPAINGFNWSGVDVHAGGEAPFDHSGANFACFGERSAGDEYEAELSGHRVLDGILADLKKKNLT
jgi:hypothetical protein